MFGDAGFTLSANGVKVAVAGRRFEETGRAEPIAEADPDQRGADRQGPLATILIRESDPRIVEALLHDLAARGYVVVQAASEPGEGGTPAQVLRVLARQLGGEAGSPGPAAVPAAELVASDPLATRGKALLPGPAAPVETVLRVGPLELDLIARRARRGKREIELLPREFKLLEFLMRRPGQVLSRATLLEELWHYRFMPETNLVDVHIGKLRRKVDALGEAQMLHSIRRGGFVLDAPA